MDIKISWCCVKRLPREMQCSYLFTPDREIMNVQITDTTEVQLGEPVSFIGMSYRNMGEGLLTGVERTQ